MNKIGNYTVIGHIGHGAMGSVEKAQSPHGDIVAVKILYQQFALEADYVRRFKREAQLARKLSHPNVVKILDIGDDPETHRPFIVMEYIEGQSLGEILHDTEMTGAQEGMQLFSPGETIRIMRQLAGVLQAADDLGLVHRDIKPQNIILDWSGNAKLLDFGFAKDVGSLVSVLSLTGQPIGTPPYMSPEQHEGSKDIDVRSDLYSLGCTAYQMLTGVPPFVGPTGAAFARQHCDEVPDPAVKRNKNCPLNLSQVIDRLLAKNPESRHQTPAELIEDLNRVERGEVPLKLHKAKKSKKYNPIFTYEVAILVAIICMALFYGHIKYRSMNAESRLKAVVADASQLAIKHDYDAAKEKLDKFIDEYAVDNPELIQPAVALREKLLKEYAIWRAEDESRQRSDLVKQAVRKEEEQERQRELAEQERQRELFNLLRNAERWGKDEGRVKQAAEIIEKAYGLCNTDKERAKVAAVAQKVNDALAKRRPWAVLADFTIDKSVRVNITGAAVAVKFEQLLGNEFRLVTRRQISKALEELRFQSSDLVDSRKAEKFGKYVGAEYLVTGNVVQLGREITIAVQCFDIETGAISRTAEVSAEDVDDLNYMIREAAEILNMSQEKKRSYLEVKYRHRDALQEGLRSFNSGDYVNAAKKFKEVLAIKHSKDIQELLDLAQINMAGQHLRLDSNKKYIETMRTALIFLNKGQWRDAAKYYRSALNISGFEKDVTAKSGLQKALAGVEVENRKKALAACEEVIKSAAVLYNYLKKQGSGATNGFARCAAEKSKINLLRKSPYWKYIPQTKRKEIEKIYNYLSGLGKGYISFQAEQQFEKVYEETLKELRKIESSNVSLNHFQYDKLKKRLDSFISSSHYRYLTDNDKRSLMELKNLVSEYQSRQYYDNATYVRGRTFSYSRRPSHYSRKSKKKRKSGTIIYNPSKPPKGNVTISINGRTISTGGSSINNSSSNGSVSPLSTSHFDKLIKPNNVPARIRR